MNSLLTLQHDGHNSLDRIAGILRGLDEWNIEVSDFQNENNIKLPKAATGYVVAEYLRTHIKDMRNILDNYYKSQKEQENG